MKRRRSEETNQTVQQEQYSNTSNTVPRNVYTIDVSRNYSTQQQHQQQQPPFGSTSLNPNTQNDQPWRHPYAIPNYKPNAPPSNAEAEDALPPKYDDIFPD